MVFLLLLVNFGLLFSVCGCVKQKTKQVFKDPKSDLTPPSLVSPKEIITSKSSYNTAPDKSKSEVLQETQLDEKQSNVDVVGKDMEQKINLLKQRKQNAKKAASDHSDPDVEEEPQMFKDPYLTSMHTMVAPATVHSQCGTMKTTQKNAEEGVKGSSECGSTQVSVRSNKSVKKKTVPREIIDENEKEIEVASTEDSIMSTQTSMNRSRSASTRKKLGNKN